MKKKIPKFDGRPMLWFNEDDNSLEIRYGDTKPHKHEVYSDYRNEWTIHRGELSPKELGFYGDIFLGYL